MPATYTCSRCGYMMDSPRGKCPSCGAVLIADRVPSRRAGSRSLEDEAFKELTGHYPTASAKPAVPGRCTNCSAEVKWSAIVCDECGEWLGRGMQLVAMVMLGVFAAAVGFIMYKLATQNPPSGFPPNAYLVMGGFGLLLLVGCILATRAYIRAQKTHDRLRKP